MDDEQRRAFDAYSLVAESVSIDSFKHSFVGRFDSKESFARQHMRDNFNTFDSRFPWRYVNYAAYTEDLFKQFDYMDGFVFLLSTKNNFRP